MTFERKHRNHLSRTRSVCQQMKNSRFLSASSFLHTHTHIHKVCCERVARRRRSGHFIPMKKKKKLKTIKLTKAGNKHLDLSNEHDDLFLYSLACSSQLIKRFPLRKIFRKKTKTTERERKKHLCKKKRIVS